MVSIFFWNDCSNASMYCIVGVICHFEETLLKNQYFLDPQWLCDQLAKIVTIREVSGFARRGRVMTFTMTVKSR